MCLKKIVNTQRISTKINSTNRVIHLNINLYLSPVSLLIIYMFKICTALNGILYVNYLPKVLAVALAQLHEP